MSLGSSLHYTALDRALGVHQILPCQYYDLSGGHRLTGEQRLMLALLADAINVFQQGALARNTRKRMLFLEAERWITSREQTHHAFSFTAACEALGLNPDILRRRMLWWKHSANRGAPGPSTPHLRLKITPRPQRVSQRRRRAASRSRAF